MSINSNDPTRQGMDPESISGKGDVPRRKFLRDSFFTVLAFAAGCRKRKPTLVVPQIEGFKEVVPQEQAREAQESTEQSEPTEKERAFKLDMEEIVTPFGTIDMSSIKEIPDGRIKYMSSDGHWWVVEMSQDKNGRFHYSEPTESGRN